MPIVVAGDDLTVSIEAAAEYLCHFHISEPELSPVGGVGAVSHELAAHALRSIGYRGWASVEMRETSPGTIAAVETAQRFAVAVYG